MHILNYQLFKINEFKLEFMLKNSMTMGSEIYPSINRLPSFTKSLGPVSQKILRAIVILNVYQQQKCASQKNHNLMIASVFERKLTLRVARCSRCYILLALNDTWWCFSKRMKISQVCIVILRFFVKRPPVQHMVNYIFYELSTCIMIVILFIPCFNTICF